MTPTSPASKKPIASAYAAITQGISLDMMDYIENAATNEDSTSSTDDDFATLRRGSHHQSSAQEISDDMINYMKSAAGDE